MAGPDQRAIVLAVGGRGVGGGIVYPVDEVAAGYDASVEQETTQPSEAYADVWATLPRSRFVPFREGWLPGDGD